MNFQVIPENAQTPAGSSRRQPTATELSRLAFLHPRLSTKKHAQLVLRHNGFSGSPAAVEALLGRLQWMLDIRWTRAQRPKPIPRTGQHSTLNQRLFDWRSNAVQAAARDCLRHGAAGGHSMCVALTNEPRAIGYSVRMGSNRSTYGGSFKGWEASEDHHTVTVPIDWRSRVMKRGLATLGGMLTLTAQQLMSHGDIELFEGTWVEQGRGYQVKLRQGTIARLGGESFHDEDTQKAIDGVLRKVARAGGNPGRVGKEAYGLTTEEFIHRYQRYGDLQVSARDAYNVGACHFGVSSWCERVSIDLNQGSVQLCRLLEGFTQAPLIEVRRTILHVIAKYRALQHPPGKCAAVVSA